MRQRYIGRALLAAAAVLGGAVTGRAQAPANIGFDAPLNSDPTNPIPTGRAGAAGFYTSAEFVILTQTRTLGEQTVAFRGLVDSTGSITGVPGTYIGSGREALNTRELGRTTYTPGFRAELGYRFEDGTQVYANYMQLFETSYSAGASLVPPFFRSRADLADTFLTSGVFNFTPQYAGPQVKTAFDPPGSQASNTYGIWNGSTVQDIKFTQRFQQFELGGRVPLFQTDYSRVYGLAGGRFDWFFERFTWRTVAYDASGNTGPQFRANYTNTLSQRLYGPFAGFGHEVFVANQFSLSLDLTGALLLGIVKERAKYELGDESTQAKRGVNEYSVVPNANAALNLWWYPIEGVQVRIGYQAMSFFNTKNMLDPIGFNYGAIDPVYETQVFRLIHGINVGVGLFF